MKNLVSNGGRKSFIAAAPHSAGDVVVFTALIAIAFSDAVAGELATAAIAGDAIGLPAKSDDVWTDGAQLWWHPGNSELTDIDTGAIPCGKARGAKAGGAAVADLHLNI